MSNCVICLIITLTTTAEIAGTLLVQKRTQSPPYTRLSPYFTTVSIEHKTDKGEIKIKQCVGTLTTKDTVLTAASCFRVGDRTTTTKTQMTEFSALKLTHVQVEVGDFPFEDFKKPIHADYVQVYRVVDQSSDPYIDVAKVHLEIERLREVELLNPLPICKENFWKKGTLIGQRFTIVGFGCDPQLIKNNPKFHWRDVEIKVTDQGQICKGADKMASYFDYKGSFCATEIQVLARIPWTKDTGITKKKYNSYEEICENRGGPVFSTSGNGEPECLVGVVNVLPSGEWGSRLKQQTIAPFRKGKDDLRKDAIIRSVEHLDTSSEKYKLEEIFNVDKF